jgi:hypothetical protein
MHLKLKKPRAAWTTATGDKLKKTAPKNNAEDLAVQLELQLDSGPKLGGPRNGFEPPKNEALSLGAEALPEYGDIKDVRRQFGLRETFVYQLWARGKIKGVLVPAPKGGSRGKRLFSFASIRRYLTECEARGPQKAPHYPRREKNTTSHRPKEE